MALVRRSNALLLLPPVLALSGVATALAQEASRPPIRSGFELVPFQFFPPGARSLGMGATFVAVADDATASVSNPAGLVILSKPEISAHGRYTSFSGSSLPVGDIPASTVDYSVGSPSFFSIVIPIGRVRISGYYLTAARAKPSLSQPQTPTTEVDNGLNLLVDDIGESMAVSIGKASLGVSVASRRVRLSYFTDQSFLIPALGEVFRDRVTVGRQQTDGVLASTEDHAIVFNAGLLLNPNGRVSFGVIYKSGGSFAFPYQVTAAGLSPEQIGCPSESPDNPCASGTLRLPDTIGNGLAIRPNDRWLISVDLNYVLYSKYGESNLRRAPHDLYPPLTQEETPVVFNDVAQVNAGVEYTVPARTPVSFRAGVWYRPSYVDAVPASTFVTAGAGVVLKDRVQFDVAASASHGLWEGVVSLVLRF